MYAVERNTPRRTSPPQQVARGSIGWGRWPQRPNNACSAHRLRNCNSSRWLPRGFGYEHTNSDIQSHPQATTLGGRVHETVASTQKNYYVDGTLSSWVLRRGTQHHYRVYTFMLSPF